MVGLLDNVRCNPTAGGTIDFTFSSAQAGYQTPAMAGAVNGATYAYYAATLNLTQWEIGYGVWNSTTGVLSRATILFNSSGTGTANGQSGAGTKINFSSVPVVSIVALQEMILQVIGGQTLSGGFNFIFYNLGTATGTVTPNPLNGNYQGLTNNGAFTLAAPTSDCAIDIMFTNGASAGAVTFSGFTVNAVTGEPLNTTNGNHFIVSIRRIAGVATYVIKALQ